MHIFDASLSFLCVINSFSSCVCASLSSMCTMKKVGYKYSKVLFTPNSFIPSFVETFIEGIVCARHWGYRDTGKRNPHADRKGEPQNALRAKGPSRAFQNALGTQSGGPAEEALGFSLKVRVDMMKRPQILLGH